MKRVCAESGKCFRMCMKEFKQRHKMNAQLKNLKKKTPKIEKNNQLEEEENRNKQFPLE